MSCCWLMVKFPLDMCVDVSKSTQISFLFFLLVSLLIGSTSLILVYHSENNPKKCRFFKMNHLDYFLRWNYTLRPSTKMVPKQHSIMRWFCHCFEYWWFCNSITRWWRCADGTNDGAADLLMVVNHSTKTWNFRTNFYMYW